MGRLPGSKNKNKDEAVKDISVGTEEVESADVEGSLTLTTVNGNKRVFVPVHTTTKFYEFANGRQLEVFNPRYLNTDDGAHRIICDDGTCLFIRPSEGWFMHWANYTLLDSNYRF